MLEFMLAYAPLPHSAVRQGTASMRRSGVQPDMRQISQTQFASRGVLCSSHVGLRNPCRTPRCARGASAAQQQLQCGAQEFSQTKANLADSVCKPRRSVLESFGLRAPAALRGAPGTASMRRSGVQPDKGKSRRLSLQAEAFCARVI